MPAINVSRRGGIPGGRFVLEDKGCDAPRLQLARQSPGDVLLGRSQVDVLQDKGFNVESETI